MSAQSKKASLFEAVTNMVTGFLVAMIIGYYVYPMFGARFTIQQNFWLVLIFTIASLVRSYVLRRIFNHRTRSHS